MIVRNARAEWQGSLKEGKGRFEVGSGRIAGEVSFHTRFEQEPGTNPEELIGAAHASCFSMALSGALGRAGYTPTRIRTQARVHMGKTDGGFAIERIELQVEGDVPGISEDEFATQAAQAGKNCPVSKALAAIEVTVDARLAGGRSHVAPHA